ncbi:MAG: VWA domain-containing protein [Candidatus Wallbacteria bacterium]|nr:VWA domain-containing protein [Candidatus Wallbacteria bacterium]
MTRNHLLAVFLLFSFCANAGGSYQDNVVIVLDASGSMNDSMKGGVKIQVAKDALKQVLPTIPDTTNIGLLVFSAGNCKDWIFELGPKDNQKLMAAIDLPKPYGNTPLGEYMKIGADRLLEQRKLQNGYGTFKMLIVTDGEATTPEVVKKYLPDILSKGITIDVIGVDMKAKHILANSAHSYRTADNPEELKNAIREVFAEVGGGTDTASLQEAFASIAPLPDELAREIVKSLSVSGNEPIGENAAVENSEKSDQPGSGSSPGKQVRKVDEDNPWAVVFMIIVFMYLFRKMGGRK